MTPAEVPERRRAFCARLKLERERRGTSLHAIAQATKVKSSLLEGLERGDVSHWPKGIYRRAFFREYVASFGLPSDPYAAEFLELFPDAEESPAVAKPVTAGAVAATVSSLRMTFAPEVGAPWSSTAQAPRWAAAAADLALVLGLAWGIAALGVATFEWALAAIACGYFFLGTAVAGRSPGAWWLIRQDRGLTTPAADSPSPEAVAARRNGVAHPTDFRRLASQALRAQSAVREYFLQISRATTLEAGRERRRDMRPLGRRRVKASNGTAVDDPI